MELTDTEHSAITPATEILMRPKGVGGLIGTGDHKALGRLLITLSVLVIAAAEVLGFALRLDTIDANKHQLLGAAKFYSLGTLQPTGIVLVGLIPFMLGLGLVLVPLQIGARAVAFPRAAAAAVWGYFIAGTLFIVSYFTGGGAPVNTGGDTVKVITRSSAVDLWALSLILLIASIVTLSVVLVTTVFTQRTVGMSMRRVPLFSWSIVIAGVIWTLSLSVLGALMVLVWVDHSHGAIFSGTSDAFSQVVWVFNQPQIYAIAIPALGIVCDITAMFTRTRNELARPLVLGCIAGFGILSFGAYSVLSYATFLDEAVPVLKYDNPVSIVMAALVIFPVLIVLAVVADQFRRGAKAGGLVKAAPLPGAVVSIILLSLAVLIGLFAEFGSLGLHGTLYDDAVFQLVVGAAIAAGSAALFHWASKIAGANALNVMGMIAAILAGLGSGAIAVADMAAAVTGSSAQHLHGNATLNTIAVAGWAAVAGTVFLTVVALLVAVKRYVDSDTETKADPWGAGQTLEWATASPPLYENFVEIPPVSSPEPMLDELPAEELVPEVAQ
ncbi:MAG: cbb3-type cytochrome c oxidase subunit I [Actinobacteria bacterium]|nr:cbb3-type cytochrome c oxidase subunit I [Actinomycetota bacterium]